MAQAIARFPEILNRFFRKKLLPWGFLLLACVLLVAVGDFTYTFHNQGIYLLTGKSGSLFEVTDDLLLGQESRGVAGITFIEKNQPLGEENPVAQRIFLELDWDDEEGFGFVRNHLGGGQQLLTNFSRYIGSDNVDTKGLFVGGALPPEDFDSSANAGRNDSGMTYFDTRRWYHVWCNTNEGIIATDSGVGLAPSQWQFIDSRVLINREDRALIISNHQVDLAGVPVQIERSAYFVAGEPYFILGIKMTNIGNRTAHYKYVYADEPWIGNFGSSSGDVGWLADQHVYFEGMVDPKVYSYMGMSDQGNKAIEEAVPETNTVNFIEWLGPEIPDIAYFSNNYMGFQHQLTQLVPLSGDARSLGMHWGPKSIRPKESQSFFLAIGMATLVSPTGALNRYSMAEDDLSTRRPQKPLVRARAEVEALLHDYGGTSGAVKASLQVSP